MDELRYELDESGKIGVTLKTFNSLKEMDEFLKMFHNSDDVSKFFKDTINDFLKSKEAINYLNIPSKDGRAKNGSVICYHEYKYHKKRKVSAIYDNELLSDGLYTKLKDELKNKDTLAEIYNRKYFLLPSDYFKDELRRIINNSGTSRYFIRDFVSYIRCLNEEDRYFYLRNLCNVCNLLKKPRKRQKIKLRIVNVSNIQCIDDYQLVESDYIMIIDDEFKYEAYSDAPEYFKYVFNEAIKNNDFEKLFNEFTSDEISLYSNYYEKGKVK